MLDVQEDFSKHVSCAENTGEEFDTLQSYIWYIKESNFQLGKGKLHRKRKEVAQVFTSDNSVVPRGKFL